MPSFCQTSQPEAHVVVGRDEYLVDLDWNASAVVPDADLPAFSIAGHPNLVHVLVILLVVRGIHKNLVKDLVQTRNEADLAILHGLILRVERPHVLFVALDRSDVGVWTLDNVFKLGQLQQVSPRV